jgi:hypothetical protein
MDEIQIDTEKETVKLPGDKEVGIIEMLGDLVSDGISRIFEDDDKKVEDDDDDDEEEGEDEGVEGIQSVENGDSNNLGHANSRELSVAENVHRSVETGNLATCMHVESCLQ